MTMDIVKLLHSVGIVPVIKMDTPEHAVPLARALADGGLPAAEITFRSDAAAESIRRIKAAVPDIFLCAGTVLTPQQAQQAAEAGAQAIVSPGLNEETVRWCTAAGIPVIPGCATPTEVEACMRLGLSLVKLFPAQVVGGTAMLKALAGPYAAMRFMPTGGIKPENAADYLRLKNVAACGGTWIVPGNLLAAERFDEIRQIAAAAAALRDRVYAEANCAL